MSIRVPSSRGPKGEASTARGEASTAREISSTIMDLNSPKLTDDDTSIVKLVNGCGLNDKNSVLMSGAAKSSRQNMEMAVSSLAKAQQVEIKRLMEQQEKERLELKKLFDQQQKRLIQVRALQYAFENSMLS